MRILTLLTMLAAAQAVSNAIPLFQLQDLGTVGGAQTAATALNQFGQIAGYGADAMGNLHAFTGLNSQIDLTPAWASSASAYGIDAAGHVVGATFTGGHSQAALWSNGTAQALGGLGGPDSYALAINNSQQVAGMATTVSGQGHAVIYSNGGVLDTALPGSTWSANYGINQNGSTAGYAITASGAFQAYRWSPSTGFALLGSAGGGNSYALAINDHDQVAGHATAGPGYMHAFQWDSAGAHDLGTLGGRSSYAYAINNSGSEVGFSYVAGETCTHAFVYLGGVMLDLNLLVTNLTGWELNAGYAINDAGQIAGSGMFNGVEHAFRLNPILGGLQVAQAVVAPVPEPGTISLAFIGFLFLVAGSLGRGRGRG